MVLILLFKLIPLKSLAPLWALISNSELNAQIGRDRPTYMKGLILFVSSVQILQEITTTH